MHQVHYVLTVLDTAHCIGVGVWISPTQWASTFQKERPVTDNKSALIRPFSRALEKLNLPYETRKVGWGGTVEYRISRETVRRANDLLSPELRLPCG